MRINAVYSLLIHINITGYSKTFPLLLNQYNFVFSHADLQKH